LEKKTKELSIAHQELYTLKQEIEFYKIDGGRAHERNITAFLKKAREKTQELSKSELK
jgi:hypothetical protein